MVPVNDISDGEGKPHITAYMPYKAMAEPQMRDWPGYKTVTV